MQTGPIGVIAGMKEELETLATSQARKRELHGVEFTIDNHEGKDVVLAWAGIGKVAAAKAATILAARFNVRALIVTGTAAAVGAPEGRTHLIYRALQHDYGSTTDGQDRHYRPGLLPVGPVTDDPTFNADGPETLKELFEQTIAGELILPGYIATGDQFVEDAAYIDALREAGIDLLDMETGAVAQIAESTGVPWLACKSSTDTASVGSGDQFLTNLEQAAARAGELTRRVIQLF